MANKRLLDDARNMFGPLSDDVRARVQAFLADPNTDTWDNAAHVVIAYRAGCLGTTLWQAVRALDPTFPGVGRRTSKGKVVEDWARIPDALTVARAIRQATGGAQ